MGPKKVLITGSCGLVGSEAVHFFTSLGCDVTGIDCDKRGDWFGKTGSVIPVLMKMHKIKNYRHHSISIISKMAVTQIVRLWKPELVIHCAAQPSHDKSAEIPFEDFMVNATGTVNMLEAVRETNPDTLFIHVSTNKVYGDRPNQIPLREAISRYHFDDPAFEKGIDEGMSIDQCLHSPFGCSKAAADLMVQEYGKYYGMRTVCFRCGCITGGDQQGVELHGFLNYLCRAAKAGIPYTIYGHKGKQVRDNIHASDLVRAFHMWACEPRAGEVYNIGGGQENSCSILEAIRDIKEISGLDVQTTDGPARKGDHICYYTDYSKFVSHYPKWMVRKGLREIYEELLAVK